MFVVFRVGVVWLLFVCLFVCFVIVVLGLCRVYCVFPFFAVGVFVVCCLFRVYVRCVFLSLCWFDCVSVFRVYFCLGC